MTFPTYPAPNMVLSLWSLMAPGSYSAPHLVHVSTWGYPNWGYPNCVLISPTVNWG